MKPLARWTMGNVHERGWETLSESIRLFSKVYPEFDQVICYNNLSFEQVSRLSKLGVDLFWQRHYLAEFPFENDDSKETKSFAWKLVPSRLRPTAHELWVDNDVVIRERFFELDTWLKSDCAIISTGYNYDYGRFSGMLGEQLCAGFFGLPPNYDFLTKILEYCKGKPLYGFDEQGLVSLVVSNMSHLVVSPKNLEMIGFWSDLKKIRMMTPNVHFTRVNQINATNHRSWQFYKLLTIP